LQEGERRFPITVRIADRYRADPEAVGTIPVTAANGDRIPLAQLAHLSIVDGPTAVNREWAKRRIIVQANVRDRDVESFVHDVQVAIAKHITLPPAYFVRYGGQFEHLERARTRLLIVVPIALSLILVLLYFTYGKVLDALRVFTGVPFAAVGGVAALWLRDLPFSISAGVGFIALSGVSVLGDMVLVSTVQQFREQGIGLAEAVHNAAHRRHASAHWPHNGCCGACCSHVRAHCSQTSTQNRHISSDHEDDRLNHCAIIMQMSAQSRHNRMHRTIRSCRS